MGPMGIKMKTFVESQRKGIYGSDSRSYIFYGKVEKSSKNAKNKISNNHFSKFCFFFVIAVVFFSNNILLLALLKFIHVQLRFRLVT
jgi:hypothetical protein